MPVSQHDSQQAPAAVAENETISKNNNIEADAKNTSTQEQQHQPEQNLREAGHLTRYKSFDDMPLSLPLLRGLYSFGFIEPAEIQQLATVPVAAGGDVVMQAQAGSGKTGAFVVGFLQRIDGKASRTQVLVLEPTRELAQQTYDVTTKIGQFLWNDENASPVALLSSAVPVKDNIAALATACVAVGTPGRVLQMLQKGALRNSALRVLVLDEADELFSQGFLDQIKSILSFMQRDIQVVLVSATLPDEIRQLTSRFMRSPTEILLKPEEVPVHAIRQFYVVLEPHEKLLALIDLYECISIAQSIIFVNSRRTADFVSAEMRKQGFPVSVTHGELEREEREGVLAAFMAGRTRVLISTDLLGRGIDCVSVNLVINYEIPGICEKYIHRVGRAGRHGRRGAAINLLSKEDTVAMRAIEAKFGIRQSELPMDFQTFL